MGRASASEIQSLEIISNLLAYSDYASAYEVKLVRPWREGKSPSWQNSGFTRQRENEEYEDRQWDYDTGLPMKEAVRNKKLYDVKK